MEVKTASKYGQKKYQTNQNMQSTALCLPILFTMNESTKANSTLQLCCLSVLQCALYRMM